MTIKTLQANDIQAFFMQPILKEIDGIQFLVPIFETEKLSMFAPMMDTTIKGKQFESAMKQLIGSILKEIFPSASDDDLKKFPLGRAINLLEITMDVNGLKVDESKKKELAGMRQTGHITLSQ